MARDRHTQHAQTPDIQDFSNIPTGQFHDRSIRLLLQNSENIRGLIEILAEDIAARIDFQRLVPLNRSLLPENLREQEADIIVRVPFKEPHPQEELLIYILVEHQSTVDKMMAFRVLFYMTLIWDTHRRNWETESVPSGQRQLPPILPIVLYTGDREWQTPLTLESVMALPSELSGFVPRFDTLFLSVKETDVSTLTQGGHPFGWLLRVLREEHSDQSVIRGALIEALGSLGGLSDSQLYQRREAVWYFLSLILHRRSVSEQGALIDLVDEYTADMEVVPMAQTMAELLTEQGMARGIEQGIEQGREQGIEQGARTTVIENILAVLKARFPEGNVDAIQSMLETIDDIERLKQLHLAAVQTDSFETFRDGLDVL